MKTCSIEGCERKHRSKGFCGAHYQRVSKKGDPGGPTVAPRSGIEPCAVEGCDKPYRCSGYCGTHYWREKVYGPHSLQLNQWVCGICGVEPVGGAVHVDHDHGCCDFTASRTKPTCGNCVRGILCRRCNMGLGLFRDNPEFLEAAAAYLRRDN